MISNEIDFLEENIEDPIVRENFEKLRTFLNDRLFATSSLKILVVDVENPNSDYAIFHGLGFRPLDVFVTSVSNGTATVNYDKTTDKKISLNVSDPSSIRVLVGSFNT